MSQNQMSKMEQLKQTFRHSDYRRLVQMRALEDKEEDEYFELEGKAITFNEPTVLFKDGDAEYKEIIDSHALDDADTSDVFLKFNHSEHYIAVARTKNNTLEIDVREDGVYIRAKLLKSMNAANDLYNAVRTGLIDKMSFAFTIDEESYNQSEHTWTVRKINKLYDVAAVEVPAYDNTFIYARRFEDVEALRTQVEACQSENKRKLLVELIDKNI